MTCFEKLSVSIKAIRTKPHGPRRKAEFDIILKRFVRDLVGKKDVTSRMNKDDIIKYARPLPRSGRRNVADQIQITFVRCAERKGKVDEKKAPKKPEKAKHIQYERKFSGPKGFGKWEA